MSIEQMERQAARIAVLKDDIKQLHGQIERQAERILALYTENQELKEVIRRNEWK